MSKFKVDDKVIIINYGKDNFMISASYGVITSVIVDGINNSLYRVLLSNSQEIEAFCARTFSQKEAKKEFSKWSKLCTN